MTRRIPALVFTGFLALYLLTAPGRISGTDAWTRYEVAIGLVEQGRPILPGAADLGSHWLVRGLDGAAYSYFGIGQSLGFVPLYVLGKQVRQVTGSARSDWPAVLVSFLGSIVAALLAVAVFALVRQVGYTKRVALAAAALCGVGTMVWEATRDNSDTLLETLGLTAGLALLLFGVRQRSAVAQLGAGACYGFALITRLSVVFALPGIGLLLATGGIRSRGARLADALWFGAGLAPFVGFVLWFNWSRFGSVFATGYETKPLYWFGTALPDGIATFLVSPGQGLLWYVPLVVGLPLLAHRPRLLSGPGFGFALIGLGYLLGYAQFRGLGPGVWGWGPKYLLPLMPLVAVAWADGLARWAALAWPTRAILGGLIVLSLALQILSVAASPLRTSFMAMAAGAAEDPKVMWRLEWSPIVHQGSHVLNAIRHLRPGTALESVAGPVAPERRLARDLGLNTFDWWWVRALYLGIRWAWVAPLFLAATAGWSARRAWSLGANPSSG